MIQQSHSWACIRGKLIRKNTRTPMFIAALFIIAKTWKQPKYPSTEEWIDLFVSGLCHRPLLASPG